MYRKIVLRTLVLVTLVTLLAGAPLRAAMVPAGLADDLPAKPADNVPANPETDIQDSPEGVNFWSFKGPQYDSANGEAPNVIQLVVHPTNSNVIYAGTTQGVYRSGDGGENWEPRNGGLGGYGDLVISGLAIDPTNPARLVIGTWGYGVFESTDSGENWSRLTDPLQAMQAQAALAAEGAPPVIRAGGASYGHDVAPEGTAGAVLSWQSRALERAEALPSSPPPGAESARPQGVPLSLAWTPVRRVAINPTDPSELFACISNGYGLYRSPDGGQTWSSVDLASGASAYAYVFAPSNPQIRYATFSGGDSVSGLYRTINGGDTWIEVGTGVITRTVFALAVHPSNTDIVLAGTLGAGLYRSTNGGDSWQRVNGAPEGGGFYSVAFAASNPNVAYAGEYNEIYYSSNAGADWTIADPAFPTLYIEGLAIHPTQPDTVWVGAQSFPFGGVYKRESITGTFELKPYGMQDTFVLDVEQDPNDASVLYAATWGGGVFRSDDGGNTWLARYGVPYVYALEATDSPSGTILYAATFYSDWGVLKSENRGDSWSMVSLGYRSDISFDLETIYGDPDRLVAATYLGTQFSYDGGQTWYNASGLDSGVVQRLCEFPGTGRMLAATYGGGLFYSWGGSTWYEANAGVTGTSTYSEYTYDVACSPDVPGLAYAGGQGVYRTVDYGEHWTLVNAGLPADSQGLPTAYFRAVDIVPGTGDVFAGSNTSGVYLAPHGVPTWSDIGTGLIEERIRAVKVVGQSPVHVFAGTNGMGAWDYTLTARPDMTYLYLPWMGVASPSASTCQRYEVNDDFASAHPFSAPGTYCSYVESPGDQDYYSIDISTTGPVTVALRNFLRGEDYDLEFYDSNYTQLAGSWWSGSVDERVIFYPTQTGRYYILVRPYRNSQADQTYTLELAYNGAAGAGQICGTISEGTSPVDGAPITLYYQNGYRGLRFNTESNSSGIFCFYGMPSLPVGHYYYIYYPNNEYNPDRLTYWYCNSFYDYTAGDYYSTCMFDARNVDLLSPASGTSSTLPVTLSWAGRGISGEEYRVFLRRYEPSYASFYSTYAVTTSHTIASLPTGFSYGDTNWWSVNVQNSLGYGGSYYMRSVVFNSAFSAFAGMGEPEQASFCPRELPPKDLPAAAPVEHP